MRSSIYVLSDFVEFVIFEKKGEIKRSWPWAKPMAMNEFLDLWIKCD